MRCWRRRVTANIATHPTSAAVAAGSAFASTRPGDVSLDNTTVLEPEMLFMLHPNQYLPETGYLLCGEPVVITAGGAEVLTQEQSSLGIAGRWKV